MKIYRLWNVLLAAGAGTAWGGAAITPDGAFDDWRGAAAVARDARGDALQPGGIDLGRLWAANDGAMLYLRLEVERETIAQSADPPAGNRLVLYLDLDANAATGRRLSQAPGLGVELALHLGEREGWVYGAQGQGGPIALNDTGLMVMPTHSAREFELALPLPPEAGPALALVIVEESGGDRLPDAGALRIELDATPPAPVEPIPLERDAAAAVRLLSWNVQHTGPADRPEPFVRILRALQPDLINFQEMGSWGPEEAERFLMEALPPAPGGQWFLAQVDDCLTASRWPIVREGSVDGNLVCLVDLPELLAPSGLVIFNAHTPCCANEAGRDAEHDALAATWRDLLAGEGMFSIRGDEAVVFCGDFNMVGFVRQLDTLRDGELIDPATYGPDFRPARAAGSLLSAPCRQTDAREIYTWRDDASRFGPGKLDYILYSPDALTLTRSFTLWTPAMPEAVRTTAGLQAADTPHASDHLPLVADFQFTLPEDAASRGLRPPAPVLPEQSRIP